MSGATKRQPDEADLIRLAQALSDCGVEYFVIGGAAMALHGFPRMTKDIDLLLPVDATNNARLLKALASIPETEEALKNLRPEWMNKGFSTALEGEITIDLLYVAASKSFDDLRKYVQTISMNGTPVVTLDVDGMLATKDTTRETDLPDRLKLGRLKNARQAAALQQDRLARLDSLKDLGGVASTFWKLADEARRTTEQVDWSEVERQTIIESISNGQPPEEVANILCQHSPGAIASSHHAALRAEIERLAPELQRQYQSTRSPGGGPKPT